MTDKSASSAKWTVIPQEASITKGVQFYADIIGQSENIARIREFGEFFALKGNVPGHILLIGEEGMGQRTIAIVIADEIDVGFQVMNPSVIKQQGDLTSILTNLRANQVLFVPNIQLLRRPFAEKLLQVMRDLRLDIVIGQGPAARTHVMEVRPFTIIATCPKRTDCLSELLNHFSLVLTMQPYSRAELQLIVEGIGKWAGISLDAGASALIARSCDGRPGHLESVFQRIVRPLNKASISEEDVLQAFKAFGITVRSDTSPTVTEGLQNLSGVDFERLIHALLTRMGFHAELTKTTGDGGIDIIAVIDKPVFGGRYLFQCKRFSPDNLVGGPTVRDFYGAVTADRAIKGILITTSDFTTQAREFAERAGVELIAMPQLNSLLAEYGLAAI